ncbi:MAG: DNA repair protein RecO [Parcubacteria group bacterium]
MDYKYQAIVLGKYDIAETDRIYVLYTREAGKIRLVAHGVRKPQAKLAGNLETLSHLEVFVARSRGRGKITGVIPTDFFATVREKIHILEKVFWVVGVFDRLVTQEEKDEKIFDLLLGYLRAMEDVQEEDLAKVDILTYGFIFKLFHLAGYGLEMGKCVSCGQALRSNENFFSAERGGTICRGCAENETERMRITDESIKFIRLFLENKISNLGKIRAEEKKLSNLKLVAHRTIKWVG